MTVTDFVPTGGLEIGGTAGFAFTSGGANVDADLVVEWDFDNDGDFDEDVEDITSYVLALETKLGRDYPSHLTGKAGPGLLKLSLDNRDDRFSYFNTGSPLATDPFSLRTGRRIRVRTAESTPDDPVLLARDRFNRADAGTLDIDELGNTWTALQNTGFQVEGNRAVARMATPLTTVLSTVDVGTADHYAQVSTITPDPYNFVGVAIRVVDQDNHIRSYFDTAGGNLQLVVETAGTSVLIASYAMVPWPGVTIGLGAVDDQVTVYVAGVPVIVETLTDHDTGTSVGLYGNNSTSEQPPATIDEFACWDHVAAAVDGVLWTGEITDVTPDVQLGPVKVATVSAEGILARAARADVQTPRIAVSGTPTGLAAADTLARAGLAAPPQPDALEAGVGVLGPVGVDDGPALTLARQVEEVERGFLHETPEGHPAFHGLNRRADATPAAGWSDDPGTAQFQYSSIEPVDHKGQVVNRVTAGVAPTEPEGISHLSRVSTTAVGVANDCDVLLPTTAAGDLLVVFLRRANQTSGVNWLSPIWWTNHRPDEPDAIWTRVYSHTCDGTESATTVKFYDDTGLAGGTWLAHVWKVEGWYLASQGVAMAEFVSGRDPGPLDHGWGRVAALYIACYSGTHLAGAGDFPEVVLPAGYIQGETGFAVSPLDVMLTTAYKVDIVEAEDPTSFAGDGGFGLVEATVFAVRGYNGEHTVLPTIKNPNQFGASPGRFVTVNDVASQDAHNAIASHPNAPNLFATEDDAADYAEGVVTTYADDRPIVTIEFPATISAAYRNQAVRRRVGDMVHLHADADTGLGIEGKFFVESVGHRVTHAGKQWWVTWELSPG